MAILCAKMNIPYLIIIIRPMKVIINPNYISKFNIKFPNKIIFFYIKHSRYLNDLIGVKTHNFAKLEACFWI